MKPEGRSAAKEELVKKLVAAYPDEVCSRGSISPIVIVTRNLAAGRASGLISGIPCSIDGMPSPSATPKFAYDFRRPNKFTREHVRALQIALMIRSPGSSPRSCRPPRTVSQVQARGIGQLTYDEYIRRST